MYIYHAGGAISYSCWWCYQLWVPLNSQTVVRLNTFSFQSRFATISKLFLLFVFALTFSNNDNIWKVLQAFT